MVAILDADKAGFLRSETSMIQMIGRAARNVNAQVILYADTITPAMQKAMDETDRRRAIQEKYNEEHGITPQTIQKAIRGTLESEVKARRTASDAIRANDSELDQTEIVRLLEEEMLEAARNLEFERAAQIARQGERTERGPDDQERQQFTRPPARAGARRRKRFGSPRARGVARAGGWRSRRRSTNEYEGSRSGRQILPPS